MKTTMTMVECLQRTEGDTDVENETSSEDLEIACQYSIRDRESSIDDQHTPVIGLIAILASWREIWRREMCL